VGDEGLELYPHSPEKTAHFDAGDAESDAIPPDLPQIAAELRGLLTPDELRELAGMLLAGEGVSR
jgi:hypothetical protein